MAYTINLNQPPENISLLTDDVHVWCALLDVSAETLQLLVQTLDSDERMRASRFYFEQDRTQFIVRHGLLRKILASYLNIEPDKLQFSYTSNGKPYLLQKFKDKELQFSLAHSHQLALYAMTFDRRIGIDIEQIYNFAETDQLANRILSRQEKAELRKHLPTEQLETLFRYWTCKEAYAKATGEGMSLPLKEIHSSLFPGAMARLISIKRSVQVASRWSLQELHPVPGFAAALVIEGHDYRLSQWQWSQI
jgi:4'-phosphopantetheinyl transferase